VAQTFDYLQRVRHSPGLHYNVIIESGHQWQEQLNIEEEDYRHVTITSEDSVVNLADGFPDGNRVARFSRTISPIWDIFLDGSKDGTPHNDVGLYPRQASVLIVTENKGVTNCDRGVSPVQNSTVLALGADFSGNTDRGASFTQSSWGYLNDADLSGCGTDGEGRSLRVGQGCVVHAQNVDLSGALHYAFYNTGGFASIRGSDLSNPGFRGALVSNGRAIMDDITVSDAQDIGVRVQNGGVANLNGATITGSAGNGLFVEGGGMLEANAITIEDSDKAGVNAFESNVQVKEGKVANNAFTDIITNHGSRIVCSSCETSDSTGGDPHENDLSVAPNEVHGEGIIFAESTET
jgi:uncharacterized protein YjbI with pentapeptide repeats